MNSTPLIFLGLLLTMAASFWAMLFAPQLQIGRQQAVMIESTGEYYPGVRAGEANQGAEIYRSLGCAECHSRQVRGLGADRQRGWGPRISVAQDYLHDSPVQLGSLRLGPDLANYGLRQPGTETLLLRLYNARQVQPGSTMPHYPFLFEKRRLASGQTASTNSLRNAKIEPDYELIPKPEARALAAYLQSLRSDVVLFEAPVPLSPTNKTAAAFATNAPAATNALVQ